MSDPETNLRVDPAAPSAAGRIAGSIGRATVGQLFGSKAFRRSLVLGGIGALAWAYAARTAPGPEAEATDPRWIETAGPFLTRVAGSFAGAFALGFFVRKVAVWLALLAALASGGFVAAATLGFGGETLASAQEGVRQGLAWGGEQASSLREAAFRFLPSGGAVALGALWGAGRAGRVAPR